MDQGNIAAQGSYDELKETEILSNLLEINKINKESSK